MITECSELSHEEKFYNLCDIYSDRFLWSIFKINILYQYDISSKAMDIFNVLKGNKFVRKSVEYTDTVLQKFWQPCLFYLLDLWGYKLINLVSSQTSPSLPSSATFSYILTFKETTILTTVSLSVLFLHFIFCKHLKIS